MSDSLYEDAVALVKRVKEAVDPMRARQNEIAQQMGELQEESNRLQEEINRHMTKDFFVAKKLIGIYAVMNGGKRIKAEPRGNETHLSK